MKKRYSAIIPALLIAPLLWGCSQTVTLRIKKAPPITLSGVNTLRVSPFTFSGKINLDIMGTHSKLGRIIKAMGNLGVELILGDHKRNEFINYHHKGLRRAISNNGYFALTEGNKYDAMVNGHVVYSVKDVASQVEELNEDSVMVLKEKITRRVDLEFDFNIVSPRGQVLGQTLLSTYSTMTVKDVSKYGARDKLKPWDEMMLEAINESHHPFLQRIAPYEVYERRVLEKGDHGDIKKGNKLAEKGDWMAAIDIWKRFENSANRHDKAASLYNQAIFDELEGNLEAALEKYQMAKEVTGNQKYNTYINRVTQRIEDEALLNEAEEKRQ